MYKMEICDERSELGRNESGLWFTGKWDSWVHTAAVAAEWNSWVFLLLLRCDNVYVREKRSITAAQVIFLQRPSCADQTAVYIVWRWILNCCCGHWVCVSVMLLVIFERENDKSNGWPTFLQKIGIHVPDERRFCVRHCMEQEIIVPSKF